MVEKKICEKLSYINRIYWNLKMLKLEQMKKMFAALKDARIIIIIGGGRSFKSICAGLKGIKTPTLSERDTGFRWRNMELAAPDLREEYGKVVVLVNTGSGETSIPKQAVKEFNNYIKKENDEELIVCTVTSKPDSTIAKKSHIVVELRGREEVKGDNLTYSDTGIMADIYELASLLFFQKIKEAFNKKQDPEQIPKKIEEEMEIIGRLIDDFLDSEMYSKLVKESVKAGRVTIGGRGPSFDVAEMTAIRTMHVKRLYRGNAFPTDSFNPPPMPGNVLLLISFSGETIPLVDWCWDYRNSYSKVFSIVGNSRSPLSKASNKSYTINSPVEQFYARAAFLLSAFPGGIIEFLKKIKYEVPENLFKLFGHTTTQ